MPRHQPIHPDIPEGKILAYNLKRLGYSEEVIKMAEIARLVTEKTEKKMSRQRISTILNAIRVTPETFELIARAIGVKPAELKRLPKK